MKQYIKEKAKILIKKAGRITRTDMDYVARGGSWLMFGRTVATLFGFLLTIGFANLLPPNAFGTYKYVLSMAAVIGIFSLTGLNTSTKQAVARGFEGALSEGFRTNLKWGIGMTFIGFGFAGYYFLKDNSLLGISFLAVGALLPIMKSASLYSNFLVGKKNFRAKVVYGLIGSVLSVTSLLLTILVVDDPAVIVTVYFSVNTLTALIFYWHVKKKYSPNKKTDPRSINYGKHLSVMKVAGKLAGELDKLLMFHFFGPAQLAIYTFARSPIGVLRIPYKPLETLLFPKLAERSIPDLKKSLPRKAFVTFLVFAGIATVYIFTAPIIFNTLFPQYVDSVIYSQVLALGLLFVPSLFFDQTLLAHMKKRQLYSLSALPFVKAFLLVTLIPAYGMWGAVIALLSSQTMHFFAVLYLFSRLR